MFHSITRHVSRFAATEANRPAYGHQFHRRHADTGASQDIDPANHDDAKLNRDDHKAVAIEQGC
ncbi:MAG: hypothetical protein V3R90_09500 [Limibaculum sp.]